MTTDTSHAVSLAAWAAEAEAAAGIARALAGTPFVPEQLRRYINPDARPADRKFDYEGTVATVTAVLLAGQELGFGPMASLRSITIIKGTVGLYALAARALVQQHGHEIVVRESTDSRAVVDARRAGGEWQRSTWTLDRAKLAGLYPGDERSNWRRNPKAMLVARASAEAARWIAASELLGLPAMAEELEDGPEDGQLAIANVVTTPEGTSRAAVMASEAGDGAKRTTKRRTSPARAALPAPASSAPPQPPAEVPAEPAEPPGQITEPQRRKLLAGLREMSITGRSEALGLLGAWVGHPVDSTKALTAAEATVVLDRIGSLLHLGAQHVADEAEQEPRDPDQPDAPPPDDQLEADPP